MDNKLNVIKVEKRNTGKFCLSGKLINWTEKLLMKQFRVD